MTKDEARLPCHACENYKKKQRCPEDCKKLDAAIGEAKIKLSVRETQEGYNENKEVAINLKTSGPLDDPGMCAIINKIFATYKPTKKKWFEAFVGCEKMTEIAFKQQVTKQRVFAVIAVAIKKTVSVLPDKQGSKSVQSPKKFKDYLCELY